MKEEIKKELYKQGYRLVGNHSATKVCDWTKKSIRCQDVCYKNTFYGINSWQCIQSTVALLNCTHACQFCWRYLAFTKPEEIKEPDDPNFILDGLIKEHTKYLRGFGGNKKIDKKRYEEALKPKHVALSLAGDCCFYPKLPELIDEIHKRKMTSFLVTNGTLPGMLKKLIGKHEPTQLYITLPAPDEETYTKVCRPLIKDGWKKLMKSLKLLDKFKCRKAIRLTLVKGLNLHSPERYAEILKNVKTDFIECKAYVWVGYSQERLPIEAMPRHNEIQEFSEKLAKELGWKIVDEKKESRVVLLMKNDNEERKLKF